MSKKYRKLQSSNFTIKALQTYKVIPITADDESPFVSLHDPRATRSDGGRILPTFYDDGTLKFSPS
jgi:hypothetical protein